MKKGILFTIVFAIVFSFFNQDVLAVIQLDTELQPNNLPNLVELEEAPDPDNPESAITQTVIIVAGRFISQILLFAASISIIFLVFAGFNYITAYGKDEKIEKGKRGAFWAVLGLLITLFSYAIVQTIISFILRVDVNAI